MSGDAESGESTSADRWPAPADVLAALDTSGQLLEQQIATDLVGLGYHVMTNRAFTDTDEGKSREIDVYAYKSLFASEEKRVRVGVCLLIECKKTSAPFAFLTRPVPRRYAPPEEVHITFHTREERYQEDGNARIRRTPMFDALGLRDKYWGTADPVKAVTIARLERKSGKWNASNTGVFDSMTWPMAKAVRAFQAPFKRNQGFRAGSDLAHVRFCIPMVVIASRLYVADGTSASPQVVEVPHVRFQREFKAKGFEGEFGIDFVQRDAFTSFVHDTIDAFGTVVAEMVEADVDAVIPPDKYALWPSW